jgi:hypothetical protein
MIFLREWRKTRVWNVVLRLKTLIQKEHRFPTPNNSLFSNVAVQRRSSTKLTTFNRRVKTTQWYESNHEATKAHEEVNEVNTVAAASQKRRTVLARKTPITGISMWDRLRWWTVVTTQFRGLATLFNRDAARFLLISRLNKLKTTANTARSVIFGSRSLRLTNAKLQRICRNHNWVVWALLSSIRAACEVPDPCERKAKNLRVEARVRSEPLTRQ